MSEVTTGCLTVWFIRSARKPEHFGTFTDGRGAPSVLLRLCHFSDVWVNVTRFGMPTLWLNTALLHIRSLIVFPFRARLSSFLPGTQVTVEVHPRNTTPQLFKKLSFRKGTFPAREPALGRGDIPPFMGTTPAGTPRSCGRCCSPGAGMLITTAPQRFH